MTTIRERIRGYRTYGDIPPTPEDFECGVLRKLAGSGIVMAVGLGLSAPAGWLLVAMAEWLIPVWVAAVLGLALAPLAMWCGQNVGGPVADHVLDIPREVSA